MTLPELFFLALGLSMDAFAVSLCKGLSTHKPTAKHYLLVGAWFGGFQAIMPLFGFFLASGFYTYISRLDHWITFGLLTLIGGNMIKEALSKDAEQGSSSFSFTDMAVLALATSIDAMAVGISFALLPGIDIFAAVGIIGAVTFAVSMLGLKLGSIFGLKLRSHAEFIGGVILILLGVKILLEHLGVIKL